MEISGNKDTDTLILEKLNNRDLLNICKINNRYISKLCNEDLFRKRILTNFSRLEKQKPENLTWKKYYIYLMYWTAKLEEDFGFISDDLRDDPKKYYRIISRYQDRIDDDIGEDMKNNYYYKLLTYFEEKVANDWMFKASELGYIDLIKYFIEKGAKNFQFGLNYSASASQKESFDFFIKLGTNIIEALRYAPLEMEQYIRKTYIKK